MNAFYTSDALRSRGASGFVNMSPRMSWSTSSRFLVVHEEGLEGFCMGASFKT